MRSFWSTVCDRYLLEDHHLLTLEQACRSYDRAEQARAIVDDEGPVVAGQGGVSKAHPAVAVERDSRAAFLRALRQLDLEGEVDAMYRRRS